LGTFGSDSLVRYPSRENAFWLVLPPATGILLDHRDRRPFGWYPISLNPNCCDQAFALTI
jgi:hypothetical protein